MSLRTDNLEDLVRRAKMLTELMLASGPGSNPHTPFNEARDLLSRINAHEAIHGDVKK